MSRDFPHDMRDFIERLDRAVPPHTKTVVDDGEADPLVDAARRLAQGPDVRLSPAAASRIEARLRQQTAALYRPARLTSRPSWSQSLRYAAAVLLVIFLAATVLTSASANSLPGDRLYPAKRAVEDVRLALVPDAGEAGLRVDFAGRRIDEFLRLMLERGEFYPQALEEASDELNQALDLLAEGHGDRVTLEPRINTLTQRQAQSVELAAPLVAAQKQQELQEIADENKVIQRRLTIGGWVPLFVADAAVIPTLVSAPNPRGK
jgi:hypothetical protein